MTNPMDRTLPPAEFVQACAPCERCDDTRSLTLFDRHPEPCPDCRIELVGPCLVCNDTLQHYKLPDRMYCTHTRKTLGHAYAVGQPLPIILGWPGVIATPCLVVDPDGTDVYEHDGTSWCGPNLQGRLAHYGPPESLVGKWALQLDAPG